MSFAFTVSWTIITLIILGGGIWVTAYFYSKFSKIPDVDKNTLVINPNSEFTDNHGYGWLYGKVEKCANGLFRVKYVPIDKTKDEKKENKLFFETAIVDDIHENRKGTISGTVTELRLKPRTLEKLKRTIPSWSYGSFNVHKLVETDYISSNINSMFGVALDSINKELPESMKKWNAGELTQGEINKLQSTYDDRIKQLMDDKGKKEG